MFTGRRPLRRQREGGGRLPHTTSHGSAHRSGADAAGDAAGEGAGEGAETSGGASGEAPQAAPGSPTAPASSFAGQQEGVREKGGAVSSPINTQGAEDAS